MNQMSFTLCLIAIATLLAFLVFNFNPASIFLGDAGAMLLGFFIASLSLITNHKAETALTLAIPFIAIGLPVFDTLVAFLRRWSRRVPISTADRKHIHHVLLSSGLSTKSVVLILYAICIIFSSVSYLLILERDAMAMIFLSIILIIAFLYAKRYGIINTEQILKRIREDHFENKRSSQAQVALHKALQQFNEAKSIEEIWMFSTPVFEAMHLDKCTLTILNPTTEHQWKKKAWQTEATNNYLRDEWSLTLKITLDNKILGQLTVWKISEGYPVRDIFNQLDTLRDTLTEHLNEHLTPS